MALFRRHRLLLAALAGIAWALLPVPIDIALWHSESAIIQYALIIDTLQSLITGYLVYVLLGLKLKRPWTCPVCKGRTRIVTELVAADRSDVEQIRSMFAHCPACNGKGIIWRPVNDWEGQEEDQI